MTAYLVAKEGNKKPAIARDKRQPQSWRSKWSKKSKEALLGKIWARKGKKYS